MICLTRLLISFRINEINSQKFAQGKYLWNVLKNRSNEILTNEARIRREPSVLVQTSWLVERFVYEAKNSEQSDFFGIHF